MADFSHVLEQERKVIKAQRQVRESKGAESFKEGVHTGLAISGGGIRSASFAMGVLEALNAHKLLEKLDYVSTVSGGGYIGSSWTWFNYLARDCKNYFFPFGKWREGVRFDHTSAANKILGYLRQHGNYLVPGFGVSFISAIMVVLRNVLLPVTVYMSLLMSFFLVLLAVEHDLGLSAPVTVGHARLLALPAWLSVVLVAIVVLLSFAYALYTWLFDRNNISSYRFRTRLQIWMGYLGSFAVLSAVIASLPFVIQQFVHAMISGLGGVVGVLGGIWHFFRDRQGKSNLGSSMNLVFIIAAMLVIFALLAVSYYMAMRIGTPWYALMLLAVGLGYGYFINLNYFGLGRMYRDRLIETFLPNPETVETGQWTLATDASTKRLSEFGTAESQGPYHLVNCNVVALDAADIKYRGRGGDNFILSGKFCGCQGTEWVPTTEFNNGGMTLATAMAISGAAANPHTGANGIGPTRNRFVSFLMFMLGLRLGYYVINPRHNRRIRFAKPNFLRPGIRQGLLGRGFDFKARYLELTDGGHFENTAVYELIRRRLKLIILSEAGADPEFGFGDLANLVEKIRVDFGVYISFVDGYDLRYLMPGSVETDPFFAARYAMARRGFAIAHINYPPPAEGDEPEQGLLLFIKATMVKNLPADIYGYKDLHPDFPNQSTTDQFFDETQLESYRELGYQLADDMLKEIEIDADGKYKKVPAGEEAAP